MTQQDMDPTSLALVAGAIGGASSKFVEKTWESAERFLAQRITDQQPAARQQAVTNLGAMVNQLAGKVWHLEQESELTKSVLEAAFADPQFGALLQAAAIGASQTSNPDKHGVLSSLITERLKVGAESLFAVASESAVETVRRCTPGQLRALALNAALTAITPGICSHYFPSDANRQEALAAWLDARLKPLGRVSLSNREIQHLRAIGCLFTRGKPLPLSSIIHRLINTRQPPPRVGVHYQGPLSGFFGEHTDTLSEVWNEQLGKEGLTPIGEMIGILVSDHVAGASSTDFAEWARS